MPANRSATDAIVDRLNGLLDRLLGPLTAPAKPAPVPVPVSSRRPQLGHRRLSR